MSTPGLPAPQRSAAVSRSQSSRYLRAFLAGSLSLLLAACGGGGGKLGTLDPDDYPIDPSSEALWQIGTGSGSNFQQGVINAAQPSARAGETVTLRVNLVNGDGDPLSSTANVIFTSPCVSAGLATFSDIAQVTTGLISANYTNGSCEGTDIITARLEQNNKTATVSLTVTGAQALSVSFVSSSAEQLQLAGIGGTETSELIFKVTGPQGAPIIGKQVSFAINTSVGEATILTGWESGLTNQAGEVRTIIRSGTVAGPVTVIATHVESGIKGLSEDIVISTGIPSANRFSISYDPFNPPDAFNTDGITVDITIIAADMFGNSPIDGTRVSFVSPEAGVVDNACLLENGTCSVTWRSATPRPADNRIEILAYTDGAEAFVDSNGNSIFDAQDNLNLVQDLSEPYADENEDGNYDIGEFYFDTNKNGVWDPGNGLWDGPCLDQVNAAAVCSGQGTVVVYSAVTVVMSTNTPVIINRGNFPTVGSGIFITQGTTRILSNMILGDNLGNPLPKGTAVGFSIEGSGVSIQGISSSTIPNTTNAASEVFGVTLAASEIDIPAPPPASCTDGDILTLPNPGDPACTVEPPELPTNVRLVLTVTPPSGNPTTFAWPLNVNL